LKNCFKNYFEDCRVGDRVTTPGRTITEADVVQFAAFSSDWNAIHTDRHYAEHYTLFGQRIAHGLLGLVVGLCLLSREGWFTFWPRSWIVLTGLDRVRFTEPVFLGDTIYLDIEIVEMTPAPGGKGIITSRARIKNQRDEVVISARVKLLAGRRPVGESAGTDEGRV